MLELLLVILLYRDNVAPNNQYLPTFLAGYTGPSAKIGGSSDYHIDLKVLSSLPLQERIRAMDSLAYQYGQNNRVIEFSNPAVAGRFYNPNAPLDEKVDLLERAAKAHGHSRHTGWDSYDFYVPFKGENRFGKSVEGASIYVPGVQGGKIRRGSGGGYGYFSESMDPSGRVLFRVGHGDVSRPLPEQEIAVNTAGATIPSTTPPTTGDSRANNEALTQAFLGTVLGNMMAKGAAPTTAETPELPLSTYEEDDKTSQTEELLSSIRKAASEKAAQKKREEEEYTTYAQGQKALQQTKNQMANLIASAQEAFTPGQAVF